MRHMNCATADYVESDVQRLCEAGVNRHCLSYESSPSPSFSGIRVGVNPRCCCCHMLATTSGTFERQMGNLPAIFHKVSMNPISDSFSSNFPIASEWNWSEMKEAVNWFCAVAKMCGVEIPKHIVFDKLLRCSEVSTHRNKLTEWKPPGNQCKRKWQSDIPEGYVEHFAKTTNKKYRQFQKSRDCHEKKNMLLADMESKLARQAQELHELRPFLPL